jgi:hypothetical protein
MTSYFGNEGLRQALRCYKDFKKLKVIKRLFCDRSQILLKQFQPLCICKCVNFCKKGRPKYDLYRRNLLPFLYDYITGYVHILIELCSFDNGH